MLGLHTYPLWSAVTVIVVVLMLLGLVIKNRQEASLAGALVGTIVAVIVGGVLAVANNERYHEYRDALVNVKLLYGDVQMVGLEERDNRVVVEKDGCTASYDIQPYGQLNQPGVWPLLPGTGRAISGSCNGPQLDKLFTPAP